jgi:hypothetical protein
MPGVQLCCLSKRDCGRSAPLSRTVAEQLKAWLGNEADTVSYSVCGSINKNMA